MIDFDTLQGLTIPEGVVAEIKDASGEVLWKSEPIVYLRPSADISFTGAKYPEDLPYGYLAISEKKADGYATYIGETKTNVKNGAVSIEGTFSLSLDKNMSFKKVLNGELGVTYLADNSNFANPEETGITVIITVLGVTYELINISDDNNETYDGLRVLTIPNEMINSINNYLATNKVLPEITLYLFVSACHYTVSNDNKRSVTAKVDQVYLALEYER